MQTKPVRHTHSNDALSSPCGQIKKIRKMKTHQKITDRKMLTSKFKIFTSRRNLTTSSRGFKKLLFDSSLEVELFKGLKRKLSLRAFINCITYEKILNILKVIDQ